MRSDSSSSKEAVPAVGWCVQQRRLALPPNAVHVWCASLNLEAARLRRLEQHLSAGERARAARFRFARDRRRFIAARGILREILAIYLNEAPRCLSFGYGAHGKPFLMEAEHSNLRFNLSHSLSTMLVAIAHRREVGVDIEHVHAGLAMEKVAEMALSAPEKQALTCIDGEPRRAAFLRFWTRKEAYIKADGRGVSLPLEHIDVSRPAGRVALLDETRGKWDICVRWMLHTLAVGPDYAAALAAEGQDWQLAYWQWSDRPSRTSW